MNEQLMTSYDGLSQAINWYSTPVKVLEWQTSLGFKPLSNDKTFVIRDCGFHVMNYIERQQRSICFTGIVRVLRIEASDQQKEM